MPIGRPEATVAVIAHGAGSTGRFVAEAFGPALADAGIELVTFEDRSGDVSEVTATLAALVDGRGAQIVGGVSLGAHAAVAVAATRPWLAGAWLVLPAWTGPPGPVAALSALAAAEVTRDGLDVVLARLRGGPGWGGWVVAELRRAWPLYGGDSIARALAAAAASPGPTAAVLAATGVRAGVVSVPADPFHPAEVARQWASLLPAAAVVELSDADLAGGPAALGRAAVAAWSQLPAVAPSAGLGPGQGPAQGSNR